MFRAAAGGSVQSLGRVGRHHDRPWRLGPLRRVAVMSSTSATTSELIFTDESRVKAKRAALVAGGLGNLQVRRDTARSWAVAVPPTPH